MGSLTVSKKTIGIVAGMALLIVVWILHGRPGLLTVIGGAVIFWLPCALILSTKVKQADEAVFLALPVGLAVVPFLSFWLDQAVPSLRLSLLIVVLFLLVLGGVLFYRSKGRQDKKETGDEEDEGQPDA